MSNDRIRDRRVQYEIGGLDRDDLDADPMLQWHAWHSAAFDARAAEPNAMVLSTIDLQGHPDARTVLIRSADRHGFTFFTNYESVKSHQMTARPVAAATFAWLDQHRQVRVRGTVERVSDDESDEYFASRPRASQIGARVDRARHRVRSSFPRGHGPAAPALGRLAPRPARVGVLAGPPEPTPRPLPLPPRR